jgi:hypothetical protein
VPYGRLLGQASFLGTDQTCIAQAEVKFLARLPSASSTLGTMLPRAAGPGTKQPLDAALPALPP